ncbi:Uncharacterised protein [Mycobacterium tuberculosis]|nr:Uncharacterised protein [Mycobacterium tuberculosis]
MIAVIMASAPMSRPSPFFNGVRSALASRAPRSAIASSTVPLKGQEPESRQSCI